MTKPTAFANFTEDQFPIIVTMYRGDAEVWAAEITEPGPLEIPALGNITRCRILLADGTSEEYVVPTNE